MNFNVYPDEIDFFKEVNAITKFKAYTFSDKWSDKTIFKKFKKDKINGWVKLCGYNQKLTFPNGDEYFQDFRSYSYLHYVKGMIHREDGPAEILDTYINKIPGSSYHFRYRLENESFWTLPSFYKRLYKLGKLSQEELVLELL